MPRWPDAKSPRLVTCDFCGEQTVLKSKNAKHHFCDHDCMTSASKPGGCLFEAKRLTCLKHFGCESHNSSQEVKEKKRETFQKTLGVNNPFESSVIKDAIKEKLLLKHGVEYSSQIPESRIKFKQTCLNRFGFENPLQNPDIFSKVNRSRRKTKILTHWKTQQTIACTASYEVAFVNWCNKLKIDFDWQIPHSMSDGRVYWIDAFIKDGEFANTWIEIKGWKSSGGMKKWEWFHAFHPSDSQLWDQSRLIELGILI